MNFYTRGINRNILHVRIDIQIAKYIIVQTTVNQLSKTRINCLARPEYIGDYLHKTPLRAIRIIAFIIDRAGFGGLSGVPGFFSGKYSLIVSIRDLSIRTVSFFISSFFLLTDYIIYCFFCATLPFSNMA